MTFAEELRKRASGKWVWRVQDKDTKAYRMQFEDWERDEAASWWQNFQANSGVINVWELARVFVLDSTEKMMREAADMLEFFFGQMQMHSPQMDGQHSYRFKSGGWPMTHCKGPTAEDAVCAAIKEIQRSREWIENAKCIKSFDCNAGDHSDACPVKD